MAKAKKKAAKKGGAKKKVVKTVKAVKKGVAKKSSAVGGKIPSKVMDEKVSAKKVSGKKAAGKGGYSASDITVLEGLEAVRRRPGMYIGTTGTDGLYHLIWEVFDNSRDEAMAGYANEVEIVLLPDDVVRVADNGRGIPTDMHPKTKVSALETIMTTLHAGGKFGDGGYTVSGGLHGVGVSVVNALSTEVSVKVHRDKTLFQQSYHLGKPTAKVKKLGSTGKRGTVVQFRADPSVFTTTDFNGTVFDMQRIRDHIRNQAFLVKSMHIRIIDARQAETKNILEDSLFIQQELPEAPTYSFFYDSGLTSFVRHHNNRQKPIHQNIFYVDKQVEDVGVEIALQYVDDIAPRVFAFGNTIPNPEGGMHVTGFKTALTGLSMRMRKIKSWQRTLRALLPMMCLRGLLLSSR